MTTKLIMPMAGAGRRFIDAGYLNPKPLISVKGKPLYEWALQSLENLEILYDEAIFIVRLQDAVYFHIGARIQAKVPGAKIIAISDKTEGAALTIKAATPYLNEDDSVIISNCDHYFEGYGSDYRWSDMVRDHQAGMTLFQCPERESKWSYADYDGTKISEVREKDPFTDWATSGIYYWEKAYEMLLSIDSMVSLNKRVNNEFYVCPIFNESIVMGLSVGAIEINRMIGLGTPEDVKEFEC